MVACLVYRSLDERGWNPLHGAASQGHLDVVKWLSVEGVGLDTLTPTGYTPMHLAAMNGYTNTMIVSLMQLSSITRSRYMHNNHICYSFFGHTDHFKCIRSIASPRFWLLNFTKNKFVGTPCPGLQDRS